MPTIQKLRYTHEALVDAIVMHPEMSQGELAALFGFTEGWLSIIIASDAFRARLYARRQEIVDPVLMADFEALTKGLYLRSVNVLLKKLDNPQVSDHVALKAAELGARALGIGVEAPPQPPADRLESLAERLTGLLTRKREPITVEEGVTDV